MRCEARGTSKFHLPPSTMARLSLIALLGLTFSSVVLAGHQGSVARGTTSWSYSNCGTCVSVPRDRIHRPQQRRDAGKSVDIIAISSLAVSPNSPSPGQNVMLDLNVRTSGVVEASRQGDREVSWAG